MIKVGANPLIFAIIPITKNSPFFIRNLDRKNTQLAIINEIL
jgi:hypothetical protein